uniref:Uncharacterized protein n=1 Tax=Leersia perrieri TaxID=77586 RepID=A0A0D9VW08_9ORYZ
MDICPTAAQVATSSDIIPTATAAAITPATTTEATPSQSQRSRLLLMRRVLIKGSKYKDLLQLLGRLLALTARGQSVKSPDSNQVALMDRVED